MSSREPMWYCHQCHAEMRPLMVPDPHCASCHGDFVEKMEDPSNDPRDFQLNQPPGVGPGGIPSDLDVVFAGLNALRTAARSGRVQNPASPATEMSGMAAPFRFEIRHSTASHPPPTSGGPIPTGHSPSSPGSVPTMTDFLGAHALPRTGAPENATITPQMMMQYLMAMLAGRGDAVNNLSAMGWGPPDMHQGRMGDYVFNQEALDQIITNLMENANATRPVAATEEIISNLPREVLEDGSPTLEKDCAVCKEQFKLETEDPDEQVVVTLPCQHTFHEGCILPWLKSSGTCPVCRYALVPQPEHHPPGPAPGGSGARPPATSPEPPNRDGGAGPAALGGFFSTFFGGGPPSAGAGPGPSATRHTFGAAENGGSSRSARDRQRQLHVPHSRMQRSEPTPDPPFPGSWSEQVD